MTNNKRLLFQSTKELTKYLNKYIKPNIIPQPDKIEKTGIIWSQYDFSKNINKYFYDNIDLNNPVLIEYPDLSINYISVNPQGSKFILRGSLSGGVQKNYYGDWSNLSISNLVELDISGTSIENVYFNAVWLNENKVFFNGGTNDIYLSDLLTNNTVMVTPNESGYRYYVPFYSKGDDKLYFTRRYSTSWQDIYRCDPDGSNIESVLNGTGFRLSVILNSDATKLYLLIDSDGNGSAKAKVYQYDYDSLNNSTSNQQEVLTAPNNTLHSNQPLRANDNEMYLMSYSSLTLLPAVRQSSKLYKYQINENLLTKILDLTEQNAGDGAAIISFFQYEG